MIYKIHVTCPELSLDQEVYSVDTQMDLSTIIPYIISLSKTAITSNSTLDVIFKFLHFLGL